MIQDANHANNNHNRKKKDMASYIPSKNANFAAWLANIAGILATSYAAYGVASGDAATLTALNSAFQAAYTTATEPTTRTAGSIAAASKARAEAEVFVRPVAVAISINPGLSAEQKIAVGVSTNQSMPTPIPAPIVAPSLGIQSARPGQLTMLATNPESGGRAKPYGATGVELAAVIGTAFTADPSAATPKGVYTKAVCRLELPPEAQGQKVSLFGRYITKSGPGGKAQTGPWSAPLQFVAM